MIFLYWFINPCYFIKNLGFIYQIILQKVTKQLNYKIFLTGECKENIISIVC